MDGGPAWILMLVLAFSTCSAFRTHSKNPRICPTGRLWDISNRETNPPPSPNPTGQTVPSNPDQKTTTTVPRILSLEELLSPVSGCDVTQMGPTTWAYVGDAVFELFVRSQSVWPSRRTSELQERVVSLVRAEHQAKLLKVLTDTFPLTPNELQIIVRGRNSGSVKGNRRKTPAYNDATALEALLGHAYITNKDRCSEILNFLLTNLYLEG